MILLIILNLLYASMFIFAKFGFDLAQPIFMTGARMTLGGIISLGIYGMYNYSWQDIRSITRSQWNLIGLLSLMNVYFANALEVWGLQYLSVGKTAFIYNLSPFIAALFAYFVFREYMTWQKWLGLTLGFLGFLPIFMGPSDIIDTTLTFGFLSLAEIALLGAAVSSIVGWTIMRLLLKQKAFSVFFLNGISMLVGGILCFIHAFYFESQPFIKPGSISEFIQLALIMAIVKHVIAYNLNSYLLTKYTTTLVAFFSFTASLFAAALGILFFHETISIYFIGSVLCVFAGLVIFYQQELRQGYISR
ncbi:MAG: DMT family transporter [Candidatus Dependentiae bacterium]|nr:DMT family transporter [Candidatus Dependentiae bacterium]